MCPNSFHIIYARLGLIVRLELPEVESASCGIHGGIIVCTNWAHLSHDSRHIEALIRAISSMTDLVIHDPHLVTRRVSFHSHWCILLLDIKRYILRNFTLWLHRQLGVVEIGRHHTGAGTTTI